MEAIISVNSLTKRQKSVEIIVSILANSMMVTKPAGIDGVGESFSLIGKTRTWGKFKIRGLALTMMLFVGVGEVMADEKGNMAAEDEFEQFVVEYQEKNGTNPSDALMMAFLAGEVERIEKHTVELEEARYEKGEKLADALITEHQKELAQ